MRAAISSTVAAVVPALKRPLAAALNHRAVGDRIGERHAELDQVRAAALERGNQCGVRAVRRRIAGREVCDQRGPPFGPRALKQARLILVPSGSSRLLEMFSR